ncbi:hypothetical protein GPJ56_009647 [Histomonas meleagridis]|uniref:uncharacterized protein n=1 Tax=Histomonas meleagridis TaxID=135588 RepID=UPI00355A8978|nr:hypothetical protein GPJ56_009647 [Histomonas meleagridis]KAH0804386.1 hypothetical protein GO595_003216 [Histomonas meleagridis]
MFETKHWDEGDEKMTDEGSFALKAWNKDFLSYLASNLEFSSKYAKFLMEKYGGTGIEEDYKFIDDVMPYPMNIAFVVVQVLFIVLLGISWFVVIHQKNEAYLFTPNGESYGDIE